jgi:hypothetical protein
MRSNRWAWMVVVGMLLWPWEGWAVQQSFSSDPPGQHHAISCQCGCKLTPSEPRPAAFPCYRNGCGGAPVGNQALPPAQQFFFASVSDSPHALPWAFEVAPSSLGKEAGLPQSLFHPPPFSA